MATVAAPFFRLRATQAGDVTDRTAVQDHLLMFTVVMGSAFIGPLFPSQMAAMIQRNAWAQHVAALLLLVLTVVWVRPDMAASTIVWSTAVVYLWYLAMTTFTTAEFLAVTALLMAVFVASHASRSAGDDHGHDEARVVGDPAAAQDAVDWRSLMAAGATAAAAGLTCAFLSVKGLSFLQAALAPA